MHGHVLLHAWDERGEIAPTHDPAAAREILRTMLEHGITTVRDLGAPTDHAIALRRELAEGRTAGPRLVTAGRILNVGTFSVEPFQPVPDEAALRAQIAEQASAAILKMATLEGARTLGLDGEIGTIAPGKRADLVLLAGNPLDDVTIAARIELVIANGVPQR